MNKIRSKIFRVPMAYINIPKDLTKVKSKVALNLTKRQLICFSIAAAVGAPVYFLSRVPLGGSVAVFLMIGVMLPFFFFAMFERDGQPAEKVLKLILRHRLWPGVRPYRTENLYLYLEKGDEIIASEQQASNRKTTSRAGKAPARKHPAGKGR